MMLPDSTTEVINKLIVDAHDEEPVCKEDICSGCPELSVCEDTKRHTRNTLRKRMRGELTHKELLEENNRRYGPVKENIHWKPIIGQLEPMYKQIAEMNTVKRGKYMAELGISQATLLEKVDERLMRNGWVRPYVEDGRLHFHRAVTVPKDEKEIKPAEFIGQKVNVEEDFIPEIELTQEELGSNGV